MRTAVVLLLSLLLTVSVPASAAPVNDTVTVVSAKPHHKHHDHGKHKGYRKGKHNPHRNGKPGRPHNPPGHSNGHNGGGNQPQPQPRPPRNNPQPNQGPAPRPQRPNTPQVNPGPNFIGPVAPSRQPKVKCVRIVKPKETRVIVREVPRTRTRTERVLYGAGIIATAAVIAGLLALFAGFVIGWFRRKRNEEKFIGDLLDNDK